MPFNVDAFERAPLEHRKARVAVPALAPFFDAGEEAEFEVRGLTATELHRAIEASKRQTNIEAIVKAVAQSGDQVQAVRKALGLGSDTPGEIAKRLEMLTMGAVSPKIELPIAVKIAEAAPIEFMLLTNKITELTGQGADMGKPAAASQPTTASI
jgi:hypothetical protein